jgi:3'-phosphoadenosine 5'-phosphosulfate sulfotransferase (PAPS reductase)/FAD synthetase
MANRHTITDLYQMQSLPLSVKVRMTARRIDDWVSEFGEDGVYLSFSGGKDSTVLVDIVRNVCGYRNISLVFVDVPTQYPELKQFAMTFDNLVVLKPKISFAEVCEQYGFPMISKEVSNCVSGARKYVKYLDSQKSNNTILTDRQTIPYACYMADLLGIDRRINKQNEKYKSLQMGVIPSGSEYRLRRLNGELTDSKGNYSQFNQEKYKFFLDAPFEISDMCCDVMKKKPAHDYEKKTGRRPIMATMASESTMRTQKWLKDGCNAFNVTRPHSNPMSFWTEQDVLLYIKENNLPICSVYGEVVTDYESMGQCENQMSFADFGIFDKERPLLKTTGCQRTGCVLCGFGCHLEKESRFLRLKETHPKFHNLLYILKNNGVTYAEAIDWVNEHGGFDIKY